jgi:integrase
MLEGHLHIPADARFALSGKKQFLVALHTADPIEAAVKIGPLVREWKARIAAVRAGQCDPQRDQIDRLAAEFRKLHDPMTDADARLVAQTIDFVFQRIGGTTAIEQAKALADARGDVLEALRTAPHAARAVNVMSRIVGSDDARTPFLTYLPQWQATLSKTKTHEAWQNICREFDTAVGQPLELLSGKHVQVWVDDLLSAGKAPNTVMYNLGGLTAYWKWMASHEIVNGNANPFKGRAVKSRESKAERASKKKVGFPPAEIPALWQEADAHSDFELFVAIKFAIYMGWRLEEIGRLKIADVHQTGGILYIAGGMKSEAGLRALPVPSALLSLVGQLVKRKDSGAYLIRVNARNRWGLRGNSIGARFGRLKARLGYDRRRSFHSIRHSFASMLNAAGVPLAMIRDLMGHETGDVTLGYIDDSALRERLVWMDRAIRFTA